MCSEAPRTLAQGLGRSGATNLFTRSAATEHGAVALPAMHVRRVPEIFFPSRFFSSSGLWQDVFNRALISGLAGIGAQVANVSLLMWMQTIMNYQYRYGGTFSAVRKRLYAEGGLRRFYRGLGPALFVAPLTRFGDVFANEAMLCTFEGSGLPIPVKTAGASCCAAGVRLVLLPIDAWKITMQVEGKRGLQMLVTKARASPLSLWHGSQAAVCAGFVGHYPWFVTNNVLRERLPMFNMPVGKHVRHALIGFVSSVVSDTFSNSLRVLKTTRQTSMAVCSYREVAQNVVAAEGYAGLFGRGLKTRILAKGLQGAVFTVGWQGWLNANADH
eukprot:NODE_674_length_1413_cov_303.239323.p1 GENE.NODE_674_length_1413_cov_303.239323~~NODE_674_length_1413_cov_303.239323.p1  ORF type:complete len:329 (-),score=60.62 NODE_674_length_1413_cov_303.239323:345-1331(-)